MSRSSSRRPLDRSTRAKPERHSDKLCKSEVGGALEVHPNVRRITGFDQQALLAAIAEDWDRADELDFGLLTLWGWDLIWKVDERSSRRVLTVMLAADW